MLWDVSWDQNNIVDGSRYSDHAFTLLKDTSIVRPTTRAPTQAATTSSGQETSQGTAQRNENNREGRGHSHDLQLSLQIYFYTKWKGTERNNNKKLRDEELTQTKYVKNTPKIPYT